MNRDRPAAPAASGTAGFAEVAFRWLPLGCLLAAAAAAGLAGHSWSAAVAPFPWIVSLALVGLPHGAADLEVTRRLVPGGALVTVWTVYAAIMAATACGFAFAPLAVMALFVALSCWHFGQAHADTQGLSVPAADHGARPPEQDATRADREDPRRFLRSATWANLASLLCGRWVGDDFLHGQSAALSRICAAVGRGAPVIGVPLLVWPAASAGVAADLLRLTGHATLAGGCSPSLVRIVGAGLVTVGLTALAGEWLLGRRHPGLRRHGADAVVDLVVIVCLAVAADPLFSVGTYFLVWHAWRQMGSLAPVVAGAAPRSPTELAHCLLSIHTASLPLLVPTWLAIGAAWSISSVPLSWRDLAILSIGAYLVVTPAHELLGHMLHAGLARPLASTADRGPRQRRPGVTPCTARHGSSSA